LSDNIPFAPIAAPVRQPDRAARTREAIASAAQRTGADFSYLMAQARIESSMNPDAKARTSSASGLYQFIDSTWLATLDRHGANYGMGGIAQAIDMRGGRARVADPATRSQIMALRYDPEVASTMAGALAQDNRDALLPVLGREPDASELYLAHFLGAAGAGKFLSALAMNPGASAAAMMPSAASANRGIFYEPSGAPRSLAGVMDLIRNKMANAMAAEGHDPAGATTLAGSFQTARSAWAGAGMMPGGVQSAAASPAPAAAPGIPSMADTLRSTFGLADGTAASGRAEGHVRAAYGKLRAFSL